MPTGICDHCGTVEAALTVWPVDETAFCPCLCHQARRDMEEARKTKKKGKKK